MLKKRTRIIICLLLILFMISIFIPFLVLKCFSQNNSFGYRHPDYKYTYPEEYHLENLRAKTSEIFKEEIESGEIAKVEVEIVYAFYDEDPEYFLITLEYEKEFEVEIKQQTYKTKYKHLMGFHFGDGKYYTGLYAFSGKAKNVLRAGLSPYHYLEFANSKKFYGANNYGVEQNGEIVWIYSGGYHTFPVGYGDNNSEVFKNEILTMKQKKEFMKNNYKLFDYLY